MLKSITLMLRRPWSGRLGARGPPAGPSFFETRATALLQDEEDYRRHCEKPPGLAFGEPDDSIPEAAWK